MKRPTARVIRGRLVLTTIVLISFIGANPVNADEWVTPKNPKHGHRLLGRVILMVEIRADGTVKKAWPAAMSTHSRAAWRAAHAAQELTFPRGADRTVKMPVTVYLD